MRTKLTFLIIFVATLIVFPSVTRALTDADILDRINALLARVVQLQNQLQLVEGQTPGPVVVAQVPLATSAPACTAFTLNMKRGSRGEEVERLQNFLRGTGHYTYPEITGYFGTATEQAVQRWQASNGVVSSGTPSATGYGVVGPKTREAMRTRCSGGGSVAIARELVVTPEVGPLPLQVTATFSLNGSSCSSFLLDWGDGTAPLSFDAENTTVCTKDIAHKRATHTYTKPGVHQVTLRAAHAPLSRAPIVNKTFVSVGDTAPSGFSLRPTSGSVPLTTSITFPVVGSTCTSYEADWGDGNIDDYQPPSFVNCSTDSGTESLTHTYTDAGTYTVRFKTGNAPISQLEVNEQWNVTVRDDIALGASVQVTPTSGIAPLIVRVEMFGYSENCTSYSLDWGDSSSTQEFAASGGDCDGSSFQRSFTHTYIAPGTYSVKTRLGSQSTLANLPVSVQPIVVGVANVAATCSYPDVPVCGEVIYSCPIGYTCSQIYETYTDRCAMERAGAQFVREGACDL